MLLSIFVCILIILALGAISIFFFFDGFKIEKLFSQEEIDFIPYIIPPETIDTGMQAVVKCSPERTMHKKRLEYDGMTDCRLFKSIYETENFCQWGCTGYGTCLAFCPQEAIILKNNTAVVTEACNGCGLCVEHCPQGLIELIPREKEYFIQCAAVDEKTNTYCSEGCTSCGLCSSKGTEVLSLELAKKCPQKCIKKITAPMNKGFKFWKMWYTITGRKKKDGNSIIWE